MPTIPAPLTTIEGVKDLVYDNDPRVIALAMPIGDPVEHARAVHAFAYPMRKNGRGETVSYLDCEAMQPDDVADAVRRFGEDHACDSRAVLVLDHMPSSASCDESDLRAVMDATPDICCFIAVTDPSDIGRVARWLDCPACALLQGATDAAVEKGTRSLYHALGHISDALKYTR